MYVHKTMQTFVFVNNTHTDRKLATIGIEFVMEVTVIDVLNFNNKLLHAIDWRRPLILRIFQCLLTI